MGMFDHVECRYPLPENVPAGELFQTKDLANLMLEYMITEDGRLEEKSGTEDLNEFTGKIEIYWSNIVASGPGLYTRSGEDAHVLEYAITFVDGVVRRVKQIKNEYQPALASPEFPNWKIPSEEETRQREAREKEPLLGKTLWLWWGGQETGYAVKVVAESSRQLVVRREDEQFEIVYRSHRDRLLFDSQEDGKRYVDERKAAWETQRQEYEEAIQSRLAAKEKPGDPVQS
jgi:hypothetical protein